MRWNSQMPAFVARMTQPDYIEPMFPRIAFMVVRVQSSPLVAIRAPRWLVNQSSFYSSMQRRMCAFLIWTKFLPSALALIDFLAMSLSITLHPSSMFFSMAGVVSSTTNAI